MRAQLFAALRRLQRPIGAIAIGLVVLQVFLAGLATAQSAAVPVPDGFDAAAICHGAGGSEPAGDEVPDAGKAWHLCCTYCTAVSPATTVEAAALPLRLGLARRATAAAVSSFALVIAPRAVRAGPSQAPPVLV